MTATDYKEMGFQAGVAAGSWVEVRDEAHARWIIDAYDDGDPEVYDIEPAPLSGEWAGESIPELFGCWPSDEDLTTYEEAFSDGFWTEVLGSARHQIKGAR